MRNFIKWLLPSAIPVLALIFSCTGNKTGDAPVALTQDSLVKRGDYLVTIMGCDDCHSTKTMGPHGPEIVTELRFGGHIAGSKLPPAPDSAVKNGWLAMSMDLTATVGAWGTTYAANISSHENGIGKWTEEQFSNALRKGKFKGLEAARPLLPPMPWMNYAKLTDTDLKAIFAFLKNSKPVDNIVPNAVMN